MDPYMFPPGPAQPEHDPDTLDLFGGDDSLPRIPAPSAPGSETSEDAADALTPDDIQREQRRVLVWYAAQSQPQTRHACAAALYEGETGPACGRINALIAGRLLEESGKVGRRALVQLTKHGRRVVAQIVARQRAA
jgi:hypothetical protein